ncbi:MAG: trypsin-like peptidase domain-containing protein [Nitrospirota bacterium]
MKSIHRAKTVLNILVIFLCIVSVELVITPPLSAYFGKEQKGEDVIKDAVVKVYTMKSEPQYSNPWMMLPVKNISGSGSIISGNRILTNAHVVADHKSIQVRHNGDSKKYTARVLHISHDSDLALLAVDDDSFFSDSSSLELGELPEIRQEVTVYGFPSGGDTLSISRGILSRMEHHRYVHSSRYFLAGQIDAAINTGSSGGPVIVNNKIAGVVMQIYSPGSAENIGYMIPASVVKHFIRDVEDGHCDGFPDFGVVAQKMENPDMKRKYGMSRGQSGLVVNHVISGSSARGLIKKDDILLAIDGHPIADDGTVEFRPKERTVYKHFIDMHQLGDTADIDVLRNGMKERVTIVLNQTQKDFLLVQSEQYDRQPRYFIFGGIVFSPLTKNLINEMQFAPEDLSVELENWPTEERKEVVVALQTLAADVNKGYHDLDRWVVSEVNGIKFKDFDELFHLVTMSTEPFIVFKNNKGFQIVIDRDKAQKAHNKILQTYNVMEDRSSDLNGIAVGNYFSKILQP